ncbi:MAG: hypothetical protein LUD27_07215 [Clostridia bacterium]|nr:hypothetical protein [Clostridia bacterium]
MKKIFSKVIMAALAVALIAAPASGCDSHEHSVSSWTITQEATCTTEGVREGVCTICYDTVTEAIPIDPDNHSYGEWSVAAPTSTKVGTAVITCEACGHTEIVTLPPFTYVTTANGDYNAAYADIYGDYINYTAAAKTRPAVNASGKLTYTVTYTYPHELGDIVFDVEVEVGSDGIQSVTDAVSIATAAECHDLIRSATGVRGDRKVDSGVITDEMIESLATVSDDNMYANAFSYEMYKEYTHILANDGTEFWLGLDDGEIYGYSKDSYNNFNILSVQNYFYGFRYYSAYTDTLGYYYGTENFLAGLYAYARENHNGDFTESVNSDGSYSFSFGSYTVYSGGTNGALFSKIEVTFTLSDSFTVETLDYYSVTYANDSSSYDSSTGEWNSDATFKFDDNGNAYVVNGNGTKYLESYTVTQTLRQAGETELACPYGVDTRFYDDFDVTYNGEVINEDTSISLVAGTTSGFVFSVTNFTPDGIIGDTLTFYYKKYDSEGDYEYVEIDYGTEATEKIMIYMNDSNQFRIKSNITGELTFAVCSAKVTKEFTINFTSATPSELFPTVYNYYNNNGSETYVNSTPTESHENTATVYAGQPVYYKASLSASEAGSRTESFTTKVTDAEGKAVDSSLYSISDAISLDTSTEEGVSVSSFTAYKTGTYVLTLTSTESSSVTCKITVTVTEIPDISQILSGTYSGTFALSKYDVTVTFGEITTTEINYTITDDEGVTNTYTATKHTVTATVTCKGTMEVECVFYTDEDGTIISYAITSNVYAEITGAVNMIESETLNIDSLEEDEQDFYNFVISLNEAFDLTIKNIYDGEADTLILRQSN